MKTQSAVLLLVVCCASLGAALRCYQCNSHNDADCKDLKPETMHKYLLDCNQGDDKSNYTLCRKLHSFIDQDFGESNPAEDRVHRDCGVIEETREDRKGECYYKSGYNTRTWLCSCYGDECNSGPKTEAGALAFAAALFCAFVGRFF